MRGPARHGRVFLLAGLLLAAAAARARTSPAPPPSPASVLASAKTHTLTLDPQATEIAFLVDAFMHKVRGTAKLVRGEIRFDDAGTAAGEVVVDATSLETGSDGRDRDMHKKVLESATFAEIALAVDGFTGHFDPAAPSEVVVTARLRIHGGEHPVELRMAMKPAAADAGAQRLTATTTFTVPYVAWGLEDPSKAFLRVGKEVEVTIRAAGDLTSGN